MPNSIKSIVDKVIYKNTYGTPSKPNSGYPKRINNIADAERAFRNIILEPSEIQKNTEFNDGSFTKLGDLHVYGLLKEMKYIPV